MRDDRLRLIFTCCHPALGRAAQVALTLRLLGGLTTAEIARAFLVAEPTMAQRIVRAKGKIRDAAHPLPRPGRGRPAGPPARRARGRLPDLQRGPHGELGRRSSSATDLCAEAIRLGRVLAELMPDEPEVLGLLALMLLVESRRPARTGPDGELVLLADQDRGRWDRALIAEGQALVRRCLRRDQPGAYQIQAAIQAVHSDAPTAADTDWRQIVALYDQLLALAPSPVVALNRAVAVAEVDGPEAGARARRRSSTSTATTSSTRSAPTCCGASAATPRPPRPTTRRPPGRPTRPSESFFSAAAMSSARMPGSQGM